MIKIKEPTDKQLLVWFTKSKNHLVSCIDVHCDWYYAFVEFLKEFDLFEHTVEESD